MFSSRTLFLPRRLLVLTGLLALSFSLTTGCATRMLMSSDRYEKPDTETRQWRSGDELTRHGHSHQNLEQRYLTALKNSSKAGHSI